MHNVKFLSHALQMVIKCADIGHLAADHTTHRQWSFKLEEEFFRQVPSVDCLLHHAVTGLQRFLLLGFASSESLLSCALKTWLR